MIENHGILIIRTNPGAADFNINKLINQIYRHISQSNKLKLKKETSQNKKKQEDKNKELEDEIKKLKLQLPITFSKKLVLISKNKIKGKSKCTIFLTGRFFIDEIQYDLENDYQYDYLQFFTD